VHQDGSGLDAGTEEQPWVDGLQLGQQPTAGAEHLGCVPVLDRLLTGDARHVRGGRHPGCAGQQGRHGEPSGQPQQR
jgi:hypothetical protein